MQNVFMYQKIEKQLQNLLKEAAESALSSLGPVSPEVKNVFLKSFDLDIPKEKEFGHLSSNIAMRLAGVARKSPQEIAKGIVAKLKTDASSCIKEVQVKGAGFINIFLKDEVFFEYLRSINSRDKGRDRFELGKGQRALIEFVSANPTGPLSVAHARQAAVGDALANILFLAGYEVSREYYLNDEGNQINILGRSIGLRYAELCGELGDYPENYYQGSYITDLARELMQDEESRDALAKCGGPSRDAIFLSFGVERILKVIKEELDDFGVRFDVWYSQKALGESGKIEKALEFLKMQGYIYEAEGAVWFKSTVFGDDKDRVVRKSDGSYTYLAPDIAYHKDKFERGFKKLINLWGPDHHGYIPRMKAAVRAMGRDADALDVVIVQLATLFRSGEPVSMSTRKGQYVTLREVLTEVGRDASRFFFLMRKTDSHLDFDLELAKKQTSENPVFYVQYAHARIAGILAAADEVKAAALQAQPDLALLKEEEEKDLMRTLFEFGYCLEVCARQLDPYSLTAYLQSLSAAFHRFYDKHKVLSGDPDLTQARLFLIRAVKIILANGLKIIGVASPERM
jgi:arginyl-tRNA synthetase